MLLRRAPSVFRQCARKDVVFSRCSVNIRRTKRPRFRAFCQQAGIPQSQDFIAGALNRYPLIASGLYALFLARLDPSAKDGEVTAKHLKAKLKDSLDDVPSIDDDPIFRPYINLIEASLRTNHFMPKTDGPRSLAIKLDSRSIDGLPEPRPWREIFVYGPEVEGDEALAPQ